MTCTPVTQLYQLTAVDPAMRVAKQIDLDGDGVTDDALGRAYDMIAGLEPTFAVAPRFPARLASDVAWLVAIDRCDDDVRVTIDQGVELGEGAGGLMIPKVLPRAVGTIDGAALVATDGIARIPLNALATGSAGWTDADGLIVHATIGDDAISGVFAAAIDATTATTELAPPIAAFLTTRPADDELRTANDTNHDGVVTADELAASPTYRALVAGDVIIRAPDGTPRTGIAATSIAFAFTAARIR